MDFSKIESSKFDITPIDSDLTQTIDQVCSTVGLFAEGKNLPFMLDIDPSIPQIMSFDGLRLQQVLINLSNNSIIYSVGTRINSNNPIKEYKQSHSAFKIQHH